MKTLAEIERETILAAIAQFGGDKLKAARHLGIGKTTLYRHLREWANGNGHGQRFHIRHESMAYVVTEVLRQASALTTIPVRTFPATEPRPPRTSFLLIPSTPAEKLRATVRCPNCQTALVLPEVA